MCIHTRTLVFLAALVAVIAACASRPRAPAVEPPRPVPSSSPQILITPVTPLPPGKGAPPTRIVVPQAQVDVAVRPIGWEIVTTGSGRTTEWQVLPDAAGHHRGSANPGEQGNVVISGHNTPGGKVFEGLAVLGYTDTPVPKGMYAYVTTADGSTYVYELREKVLLPVLGVPPEKQRSYVEYIMPTDRPRLTLVTCWPLGDTAYRLVVWGPLLGKRASQRSGSPG